MNTGQKIISSTLGQRVIRISALDFFPPISSTLLNTKQDTEIQSGVHQGCGDTNSVCYLSKEFQRFNLFLHTVSK